MMISPQVTLCQESHRDVLFISIFEALMFVHLSLLKMHGGDRVRPLMALPQPSGKMPYQQYGTVVTPERPIGPSGPK